VSSQYSAEACFNHDTRTYADVVRNKTSGTLQLYKDVRRGMVMNGLDWWCRRRVNILQMRRVLFRILKDMATVRWGDTPLHKERAHTWKTLFYAWRDRMHHFQANFQTLQTMPCRCEQDRCALVDLSADYNVLCHAMKTAHGPHGSDMPAFMVLHARMGNDLALYVFSFL
jgi:hypothetical protein